MALGDIHRRFTWQAWHLATSIVTLRGRRGTHGIVSLVVRDGLELRRQLTTWHVNCRCIDQTSLSWLISVSSAAICEFVNFTSDSIDLTATRCHITFAPMQTYGTDTTTRSKRLSSCLSTASQTAFAAFCSFASLRIAGRYCFISFR